MNWLHSDRGGRQRAGPPAPALPRHGAAPAAAAPALPAGTHTTLATPYPHDLLVQHASTNVFEVYTVDAYTGINVNFIKIIVKICCHLSFTLTF